MTLEAQRVSGTSESGFGSLGSCFVEGDPQSEKRSRRIQQRAVAISIALQSFAVVALILFPLQSKGERISLKIATPIPPYARIGNQQPASNPAPHLPGSCHFCPKISAPTTVVSRDPNPRTESSESDGDLNLGFPPTPGIDGGYPPPNARPVAPPEVKTPVSKERQKASAIEQMARLIPRIEPRYPPIAIQIHREGRVELHAIISAEGRIESLEVISGDPVFIQSALSAVHEWRYRPTILNGRPVEIDTHITVIYSLSH
jgi:protein TonB